MGVRLIRIFLFCLTCFLTNNYLKAQYQFGIQGGMGVSDYVGKDYTGSGDPKTGITAGLFFERELNLTLSVGFELNYDQKGTFYSYEPRFATIVDVDSRMSYISLPVLLKAYFGYKANFYIYTGVTGSYLTNSSLSNAATEYGYPISSVPFFPYKLNNWDASVIGGAALDLYGFILDIRYHHGLVNIYEGHNVPSIRNQFISATLGYTIFRKKVLQCFNTRSNVRH